MKKYKANEKKVNIYEIHDGSTVLDLINVLTYKDGILDRVDTFIGKHDRFEYLSVGRTQGLSKPGVVFNYSSYTRSIMDNISLYIEIYR